MDPLFKLRPMLEGHDAAILSSNYELYGDLSNSVMTVLRARFRNSRSALSSIAV